MKLLKRIVAATLVLGLGVATSGAMSADVVAVVPAKSAVRALSKSAIADIFLGRTVRFPDGQLALPVDQAEGTATRNEFYARFTGKSAAQLRAHWSKIIFTGRGKPPKAVANGNEVKKLLVGNLTAIGYVDATLVDDTVRVVILTGQ